MSQPSRDQLSLRFKPLSILCGLCIIIGLQPCNASALTGQHVKQLIEWNAQAKQEKLAAVRQALIGEIIERPRNFIEDHYSVACALVSCQMHLGNMEDTIQSSLSG
jgi:hypothetical protein